MNDLFRIILGFAGTALCLAVGQYTMNDSIVKNTRYVGLDVHKRSIAVCILDPQGTVLRTKEFALTRQTLEDFAREQLDAGDAVALEATTNSWVVAEILSSHVARVVVSNPMATKAIAKAKIKTDKVDAKVLAHLLRCDYLPEVWQPDQATQRLRQLTGRRSALVQQRTRLRNRIHSILAMRLIEAPLSLFNTGGLAWLRTVIDSGQLDDPAAFMVQSDLTLLDSLQIQIDSLVELLAKEAYDTQQVRLLMTLPGVDMLVALAVIAALGDISRFKSPKQAASYLGLVPSTRQSANRCYHGPITKQGNVQARWMLVQAAQHMGRNPGPLGNFFRRLKKRKNHNVAVVATARKFAMIAMLMLQNNEPYRYAVPRSTQMKLVKLRVRVTGKKRRGAAPKGKKTAAKFPGGSRTIKSLDRIYAEENLPERCSELPPGELAMLANTESDTFMESTRADHIVPRKVVTNS